MNKKEMAAEARRAAEIYRKQAHVRVADLLMELADEVEKGKPDKPPGQPNVPDNPLPEPE